MTSNDQTYFSGIELGMLLENAREMRGWTTSDAAMRIGVGDNPISAMEQGDYAEFGLELDMLAVKLKSTRANSTCPTTRSTL